MCAGDQIRFNTKNEILLWIFLGIDAAASSAKRNQVSLRWGHMTQNKTLSSVAWSCALALFFFPGISLAQAPIEGEVIVDAGNGFARNSSTGELEISGLTPGAQISIDVLIRTSQGTAAFPNTSLLQLDPRNSFGAMWDPAMSCSSGLPSCPTWNENEVAGDPYTLSGCEFWADNDGDGLPDTSGNYCNYSAAASFPSHDSMDGIVAASFFQSMWFENGDPIFGVGAGQNIIALEEATDYQNLGDAKRVTTLHLVYQEDGVIDVCGTPPATEQEVSFTGVTFQKDMFDFITPMETYSEFANTEGAPNHRRLDCANGKILLRAAAQTNPLGIDTDNSTYSRSYPGYRRIVAFRPSHPVSGAAQGQTYIDIRFSGNASAATCSSASACANAFTVTTQCRTDYPACAANSPASAICVGQAPVMVSAQIEPNSPLGGNTGNNILRTTFDRPIPKLCWTTVTHNESQSETTVGALAGDVDGDGVVTTADGAALFNYYNGDCSAALDQFQWDVNGDGVANFTSDNASLMWLFGATFPPPAHGSWLGMALPE